MFHPVSPQGITLIHEFLTAFAPLQYETISIPRVLIFDYARLLLSLRSQSERRISSGDLDLIPFSGMQTALNGAYPEPIKNGGLIRVDGPLNAIPSKFRYICRRGNVFTEAEVPATIRSKINSKLQTILTNHINHPIFGDPVFRTWIDQKINDVLGKLYGTKQRMEKLKPGCVAFQGNHYILMERVICEVARACRVASVAYHPVSLMGTSESVFIYKSLPMLSYRFAAWGREFQEWMREFGVSQEQVIPVGCPRFDQLPLPVVAPHTIHGRLQVSSKYVLLVDQQCPKRQPVFKMIWEAIRDEPDFVLVVKIHPHHEKIINEYRRWSENDPRIRYVPPLEVPLYELLQEAFTVVTYFSTVGIEAAYYRKPVITPVFSGSRPSYVFYERGGSIPVSDSKEMKDILKRLTLDQNYVKQVLSAQRNYLEQVTIPDGDALNRFYELLVQIAT